MTEDGDEQTVGIAGIHNNLWNLLAVTQTKMLPGPATIRGFVNAIARGKVGPLHALPASDVDHVRIGGRDRDGANRASGLVIEDGVPGSTGIGRLPHASVHDTDVEDVWLRRNAIDRLGAAAAKRPDVSPAKFGKERRRKRR